MCQFNRSGGVDMRIHYLQNDPLATLGIIEEWSLEKDHSITGTQMFNNEKLPSTSDFDFLIILGGRMGAYEEEKYPWLTLEKKLIKEAINQGKMVMGICLGAQLIANVLGGEVYPHKHQEIGWWTVELTEAAKSSELFKGIPKEFTVFQYHRDTFDLPHDVIRLASNQACRNQAFSYKNHVIGLQFHPEFSENTLYKLKEKFGDRVSSDEFIQNPANWTKQPSLVEGVKSILFTLLNNLEDKVSKKY